MKSELLAKVGPARLANLWADYGCPIPGDACHAEYQAALAKMEREALGPKSAARGKPVPVVQTAPPSGPDDCTGALRSRDGGLYLPWGPYLSPDDVRRMRGELVAMIKQLADMEHWPQSDLDYVLTRAIRGPLADLLPNIAHFNERMTAARSVAVARAALDQRTWLMEGFDERRLT